MRRWRCGEAWPLLVEERGRDWSVRLVLDGEEQAMAPARWQDGSGAFGAPSEEYRFEGLAGRWRLRVFPRERVVAAGAMVEGTLSLPPGWWLESEGQADLPVGFGPPGTDVLDLVRCERRGWQESEIAGLRLLCKWHGYDPRHGDTELLHRLGWVGARKPRESGLVLDCRGWVQPGDHENDLADAFLYLHQTHGVRWLGLDAFPSPQVERALERAHCDCQGDLFAVWLGTPIPARRTNWMRLGPWLLDLPVADLV